MLSIILTDEPDILVDSFMDNIDPGFIATCLLMRASKRESDAAVRDFLAELDNGASPQDEESLDQANEAANQQSKQMPMGTSHKSTAAWARKDSANRRLVRKDVSAQAP
jgi:hypothetical protein